MCKFIDKAMERLQYFSIWDYGILKCCLISFGVLFGIMLKEKGKKWAPLFVVTFLLSYGYLIFILFFCKDEWESVDDFEDMEDLEESMAD